MRPERLGGVAAHDPLGTSHAAQTRSRSFGTDAGGARGYNCRSPSPTDGDLIQSPQALQQRYRNFFHRQSERGCHVRLAVCRCPCRYNNEETSMKKVYFAIASGAALLALASFANAQGTGTGTTSGGAASNQCWDMSSNMARDRNQTSASGSSTGSTGSTVGAGNAGTSGTASSGSTGSAASGSGSNSTASSRPAGMPNC